MEQTLQGQTVSAFAVSMSIFCCVIWQRALEKNPKKNPEGVYERRSDEQDI